MLPRCTLHVATAGLSFVICCLLLIVGCAVRQQETTTPDEPAELMTIEIARGVVDEVMPEVERLRGLEFKQPVPVEVVSDEDLRTYMSKRLDSLQSEEELRNGQRAYQLLGLLPESIDIVEIIMKALEEQAAGYYDPSTSSYYLIDDMPAEMASILTAHELTHALEDQHFDLDSRIRDNLNDDDRIFAVSSVHEGSATLLMTQYMTARLLRGELSLEMLTSPDLDITRAEALNELPPVLQRQLLGPYILGALFLVQGNMLAMAAQSFPVEDVDHAYDNGPLSSEQILHAEKFWDPQERDDPKPVDLTGVGTLLGDGWQPVTRGVLGELVLAVMTGTDEPIDPQAAMLAGAAAWTNEAASGWGGDRWEMWERDGRAVVLLSIRWDSPDDAQEFVDVIDGTPAFRWKRNGDRVAIVAGEAGVDVSAAIDAMLE